MNENECIDKSKCFCLLSSPICIVTQTPSPGLLPRSRFDSDLSTRFLPHAILLLSIHYNLLFEMTEAQARIRANGNKLWMRVCVRMRSCLRAGVGVVYGRRLSYCFDDFGLIEHSSPDRITPEPDSGFFVCMVWFES
jgi:hypothetical protein